MIDPITFTRALAFRGYRLRSAQDGAHEVYHALTCGTVLLRDSTREDLNDKIEEKFQGIARWWNEVEARAVEQLVCAKIGACSGFTLEWGLKIAVEEADYFSSPVASYAESLIYAKKFMASKRARAAADLVIAHAMKEAELWL